MNASLYALLMFAILLGGCQCQQSDYDCEDILPLVDNVSISPQNNSAANAAFVYIDVSQPMRSFVTSGSNYVGVLTQLELSLNTVYPERLSVFSFGNQICAANSISDFASIEHSGQLYVGTATRLDSVFDRILGEPIDALSIIVTDSEAEPAGGIRQTPLLGPLAASLAKILQSGLSLRVLATRSGWHGIQRPFYVFLVGRLQAVQDFTALDTSAQHELLISPSQLGVDSSNVVFSDTNSYNYVLVTTEKGCFKIQFDKLRRMHLDFDVRFSHKPSLIRLKDNFKIDTNISVKRIQEEMVYQLTSESLSKLQLPPGVTSAIASVAGSYSSKSEMLKSVESAIGGENTKEYGNRIIASSYTNSQLLMVDATNDITVENLRAMCKGKNRIELKFDVLPFRVEKGAYLLRLELNASRSSLAVDLPGWVGQWSTTDAHDYSRTYWFQNAMGTLVEDGLLRSAPYRICKLNLVF